MCANCSQAHYCPSCFLLFPWPGWKPGPKQGKRCRNWSWHLPAGGCFGGFYSTASAGSFFFFHLHQCNEGFHVSPSPLDGAQELGRCSLGSPQPPWCVGPPRGFLLPSGAMGPQPSSPGTPPVLCEPGEGGEGDKGAHLGLQCPPWGTASLPGCPPCGCGVPCCAGWDRAGDVRDPRPRGTNHAVM